MGGPLTEHEPGRRTDRFGVPVLSVRRGAARSVLAVLLGIVIAVSGIVALASAGRRLGTPVAAERIDLGPPNVAVRVVSSFGPSGDEPYTLASSADGDRAAGAVLAELEEYWSDALAGSGGREFTRPSGGYVSMDSTAASGSALCVGEPGQIAGNTFYCPQGDGIVFDSSSLVPVLLGRYGAAGLAASFAHEFGHAVQAQVGPTSRERQRDPQRYPSILIEAQADCDAGAFLAWASSGGTRRLHVPPSSLLRAVAPLLDFRDPATLAPTDATAHGLGLDRLTFILTGFRGGAPACPAMTTESLDVTLGRFEVRASPPSTLPRYPSGAAVQDAAASSVGDFVVALALPGPGGPGPGGPGPGGAGGSEPPAADQSDLRVAAPLGQFAIGAAVALSVGRSITGSDAGGACFTGAWTASVFGNAGVGELGSWPTDADEALDLVRNRPGARFEDLTGYADGFRQGFGACR